MRNSASLTLTAALALTLLSGAAMADGESLYRSAGCVACHGSDGDSAISPDYPKLAGQNERYLYNQMRDIKSGARANGQSRMMKPMVMHIQDRDLADIAEWLSNQ